MHDLFLGGWVLILLLGMQLSTRGPLTRRQNGTPGAVLRLLVKSKLSLGVFSHAHNGEKPEQRRKTGSS